MTISHSFVVTGPINRAQVIAVPTYAVSLVEELIARPEVIEEWRDQDASEAGAG